jgi:hypothetical protein
MTTCASSGQAGLTVVIAVTPEVRLRKKIPVEEGNHVY